MIILKKRSDLLAQGDVLLRYMDYAHISYPEQINAVSVESLQKVLASVYRYTDWSKLMFDINPINSKHLESVNGDIFDNPTFYQALNDVVHDQKLSPQTLQLIQNIVLSIISMEMRSDEMYFAWYAILNQNVKIVESCKMLPKLFPVNNLDLKHLIDLSILNLVLSRYSRFFKLSEPEIINQWVMSKSDLIDKKIKHHIDPKLISEYLNNCSFLGSIFDFDKSQSETDQRYSKSEKVQLVFQDDYERLLNTNIAQMINTAITDDQSRRIHAYLITNAIEINSALDQCRLPTFNKQQLSVGDQELIISYIATMKWVMNQIVDIPNYYALNDLCLNHNGLFVVKSCYRIDRVLKPYRIFCRVNHKQPTVNFKKMITSFDMTKLIYVYLDQLKSQIKPSFYSYISVLNLAFDHLGIQPDQPISNDIHLDDIAVRIDRKFSQKEISLSVEN